jgi:hypothetical protein
MGLLTDIQNAAVDSSTPITDLLRRCLILASKLKSEELRTWAEAELNGYPTGAEVPDYRVLATPHAVGTFFGPGRVVQNVPIPIFTAKGIPSELAERLAWLNVRDPIASLATIDDAKGLERPWDGDVVAAIGSRIMEHHRLMQAHNTISPGALPAIVDTVRTRVLQFVLKLAEEFPDVDDSKSRVAPPAAVVHQIFNNAIISGSNLGTAGNATVEESTVTITLTEADATKLGQLAAKANAVAKKSTKANAKKKPTMKEAATTKALEEIETAAKANKPLTAKEVRGWLAALSHAVTLGTALGKNVQEVEVFLKHLLGM